MKSEVAVFSSLFGKKKPKPERHPDSVWFDAGRRRAGILRAVREGMAAQRQVVVLTHFRKTFTELSEALREQGITARSFQSSIDRLSARGIFRQPMPGATALMLVAALPEPQETTADDPPRDVTVRMIVAERYPVPAPDERIEAFVDALGLPVELEYHDALDEPLFELFGGGNIREMLKKFGLQEDECIAHPLVTKSIQRAREKLAKEVLVESTADSMEEWLLRNRPQRKE
jgi:hypothetical protein